MLLQRENYHERVSLSLEEAATFHHVLVLFAFFVYSVLLFLCSTNNPAARLRKKKVRISDCLPTSAYLACLPCLLPACPDADMHGLFLISACLSLLQSWQLFSNNNNNK
jgi:hypothetical protein